jgi:hypothetical protein
MSELLTRGQVEMTADVKWAQDMLTAQKHPAGLP